MSPQIPTTQPARVLVVDDDHFIRSLVSDYLSSFGFTVVSAASGADALRALQNDATFDLVIVDFNLPDITGLELATKMRALATFGMRPIMMLSGENEGGALESHSPPLIACYFQKPFEPRDFIAQVKNLIQR